MHHLDGGDTKAEYARAAMAGHSELEQDDAAASVRGEESQDPDDWTDDERSV